MDERIKQIADHYGYGKQKMQLMEEMGKLMQAVSKFGRAEERLEKYNAKLNLIDELVDVQIMIDQFRELFYVSPEYFERKYNLKLERQMNRVNEEKPVWVIDAVHDVGGVEHSWRVPEDKKIPKRGDIVYVHAKGQVKPVIVQNIRRLPKKYTKELKTMVGDKLEHQN